ncbi:MAG: aldo/keto reductase [Anaerolineae bacterium]|nr:MAG: aldo/keto reductase [Anaerolineae bacterium]
MPQPIEPQVIQLVPGAPAIPQFGFGAWQWGDRLLWNYGTGEFSDEDLRAAYAAAIEAGVNFFDTAEVYGEGRSETLLGKFIADSSAPRPLVASKFAPFPTRLRKQALLNALQASLDRLAIDCIDLYQIHFPPFWLGDDRWLEAMAEAVSRGLIRGIGVSNYSEVQTRRAHARLKALGLPLLANQVEYSLLERSPEREGLLKLCEELGVQTIAYSPLAKGLLSGKYTSENPPPGLRGRRTTAAQLAALPDFIALLRQVGDAHGGKTPAQVSLNWIICKGAIPIPGVKNAAQTIACLGALGWRLSPNDIETLDQAALNLPRG